MKRCFKCGVTKPLDEFYRHARMADGHLGKCKACAKADVRANRHERQPQYRAYDRSRSADRDWTAKTRRYRARHPERTRVYDIVARAVARGRLVRPRRCEGCGLARRVDAHHDDYSKPLLVRWLCAGCHTHVHQLAKA